MKCSSDQPPKEAEAQLRGVLALDSNYILANSWLGTVHLTQGRAGDALPLLERAIDPSVRYSLDLALLGYGYSKADGCGRRRHFGNSCWSDGRAAT
jgi:hypothetical protein